jgi:hypothetical protein
MILWERKQPASKTEFYNKRSLVEFLRIYRKKITLVINTPPITCEQLVGNMLANCELDLLCTGFYFTALAEKIDPSHQTNIEPHSFWL